jgi:hypothetical protein
VTSGIIAQGAQPRNQENLVSVKVGMLCGALVASLAFAAGAQEASTTDRVEW